MICKKHDHRLTNCFFGTDCCTVPFYISTSKWSSFSASSLAFGVCNGLNSEKAMAPHSSTLAWKIPWTEEPGRLQSMGSLRVGQNWATSLSLFTFMHCWRKWQPTPVFLPRESQGQRSLVGFHLCGRTESDMTDATWQHGLNYVFLIRWSSNPQYIRMWLYLKIVSLKRLNEVIGVDCNPIWLVSLWEDIRTNHTQRKDHVKTQGEFSHL